MSCLPMTAKRRLQTDLSLKGNVRHAELEFAGAVERLLQAQADLQRGDDPLEALLIQHQRLPSTGKDTQK